MKIDVLCSDKSHPVIPTIMKWIDSYNQKRHDVKLIHNKSACRGGDILFLISCVEIVRKADRDKYRFSLVVHASDLPKGRGWSPLMWNIGNGENKNVVTLLNVADPFDTGAIWKKEIIEFRGDELYNEINERLFECESKLMSWFVDNCEMANAVPQMGVPSYWPRRCDDQNRIDVDSTISSQFDKLRVCDPHRFPAFFDYSGWRYSLRIEKPKERLIGVEHEMH